ncbi:MAG: ubiquinol-cytochrome c reductase iron-sulfur subunit [Bryobacteraceae bacterium]
MIEKRRGFLVGSITAMMGAIGAAMGVPALGYLFVPAREKKRQSWIEAADLTKLMVDQPEQVIFQRVRRDGWKLVTEKAAAWVVKTGEKKVVAFSPVCTHLGCAVSWNTGDKTFACPCHTSTFSPDGQVLGGPAPRPLDRFDVRVDGIKVMLGEIKQSAEG